MTCCGQAGIEVGHSLWPSMMHWGEVWMCWMQKIMVFMGYKLYRGHEVLANACLTRGTQGGGGRARSDAGAPEAWNLSTLVISKHEYLLQ
jgi:hypothetical protein